MKIITQILIALIMVAAALTGVYFFLDREYAKKSDLDQANQSVAVLQTEIDALKNTLVTFESTNKSGLNQVGEELVSFQQKLKTDLELTNNNLLSLQNEVKELTENLLKEQEIMSLLERQLRALPAKYHLVDISLGSLPVGKKKKLIHEIPAIIPATAREILVYAYVKTGYVTGGSHDFKISVQLDESKEAAFYIFATAHQQAGYSYNSENIWLPMPKDRKITIQSSGERLYGDWESRVRIIAYR